MFDPDPFFIIYFSLLIYNLLNRLNPVRYLIMGEPQSSYAADFSPTVKNTCDVCKTEATLKYMRHKNPEKLGRHLCSNCYQHYLNKEGTIRRSATETQTTRAFGMDSEYHQRRQVIHKQIAEAQRGRTCQMSL